MPFGRLSPVSETDTESLHTIAPSTTSSDLKPRPLNFSRPRPQDIPSSLNLHRDNSSLKSGSSSSTTPSVRALSAFYSSQQPEALPDEPRFDDYDSEGGEDGSGNTETPITPADDFGLDFREGEPEVRYELDGQPVHQPSGNGNTGGHSTAGVIEHPMIAELPGSEPPWDSQRQPPPPAIPHKVPRILKRMSVDQQSERRLSTDSATTGPASARGSHRNLSRQGWEDGTSHHTLSLNGEAGESMESVERWNSSDADISGLSDKKIAKLRKKGINPRLYMEMKAARGGKGKLVGPLVGNTYIG